MSRRFSTIFLVAAGDSESLIKHSELGTVKTFGSDQVYNVYIGDKDMNEFAERLKELRLEKGLSMKALAEEVEIGVASICRWENAQTEIKGYQLIILAQYFGVTIDYLMGLED